MIHIFQSISDKEILYFSYIGIIVVSIYSVLYQYSNYNCLKSISDSLFADQNALGVVMVFAAVSLNILKNSTLHNGLFIMFVSFLINQPIHTYLIVISVNLLLYECYSHNKYFVWFLFTIGITLLTTLGLEGRYTFGAESNNISENQCSSLHQGNTTISMKILVPPLGKTQQIY